MKKYFYILICYMAVNCYLSAQSFGENDDNNITDDNITIDNDSIINNNDSVQCDSITIKDDSIFSDTIKIDSNNISNDSIAIDSTNIVIAGDSTVYIQDLFNENLPLMVINTVDGEEPTFDVAETPPGCWGKSITNVTKVPSRMYIIQGKDTLYDSGDYENDKSGMTIKVRGNTSAINSLKKSYKIKLQKKADLLCRGNDDVYKDKEWALLRDENNLTNTMTGFAVSKLMDFSWIPSYEYANVVMNGVYRGIYLLAEPVKRNEKCRIDVDEDTGYIIEYDPYWWNEDLYFNSSFYLNYTFKYPDSDDVTDGQMEYIQNVVDVMETSLDVGTYPKYIDVSSFANWLLTHDLLGTSDGAGSNMFMTKYDSTEDSKLKMSTPWDFESIEKMSGEWATIHDWEGFLYNNLFNSPNHEFTREYINIWNEKKDELVDKIIEKLDSFEHSDLAVALDYYSPLDKKIDHFDYGTISEEMEASKQWFAERKEWMNDTIAKMDSLLNRLDTMVIAGDSTLYYQDLMNENLPLIVINTVDDEEPTFDMAEKPEGALGKTITNATKVPGQMYIILGNDTIYNTGEYEEDISGMTVKVRGNTSAFGKKKSYKIKLQKKADLLCRGNNNIYKDKEWVLLRDESNLTNNMTGFTVSKLMDFSWIPSFEYANVVMNGIYRGIYLLAEPVKRNEKCRIDVDKNSGYIIENDPYWWNEDLYFDNSFSSTLNYTFKYPDSDDVTDEQLDYIRNAVNDLEVSVKDGTYPKYLDVNSFACWVLTHDLLGTGDGAGSNIFFSKYDSTANSKFKMETPWDFDTIKQMVGQWTDVHSQSFFFYKNLFNSDNYEFTREYINVWNEKKDELVDRIIEKLDSFEHSDLAVALDYYSPLDKKIDLLDYGTISEQIEESKQWLAERKAWMNDTIAKMDSTLYELENTVIASDSTLYYQDLMNENLPLIVINTVYKEEPSFDSVETPEGCIGTGINNVTKVPGQLYIILGNDTIYNTGEFVNDVSGMTINLSSDGKAKSSKKDYTIKLQKKADMLCRDNDDVYKDNEWVLLRNFDDLTSNMTGFTVAELMDFAWTPSYEYANVVINGNYKGIYMLAESPKRNADCRIDVDEDSGYIIENNPYWWNDNLYFDNSLSSMNYTFLYPDSLDVNDEQLEYIQNVVNDMETSFDNGTYPEYIDVNSFASWCLTHDILGTSNQAGSNMFLSKYDSTETSKFRMETPWNFESIKRTTDVWANIHKTHSFFYFGKLFDSDNYEFKHEYINIWNEKKDEVIDEAIEKLDDFEHSDLAAVLDYYSPLDKKVASVDYGSITDQIEADKQWLTERKAWMNDTIAKMDSTLYELENTVIAGDSTLYYQDLMDDNLPLIVINTVDKEEPSFDSVETPEGCIGNGITNVTKAPGQMYIILGNDTIYNTGEYEENTSGMTINIGDGKDANSAKKSYAIKLQEKADLLSRDSDDIYIDDKWTLLSDESNLTNNMTGFTVSKLMDFTWTPSYEYTNVVMNGIYRGIYLLTESVGRNADCRINVDENSGYIIENNPYWWNDNLYFDNSFDSLNYTFIYPDSLDVTDEQLEYIQNAVNNVESSLDNGTYSEYIDVSSFANWCLTHDLLGTYDDVNSNMFISKYDSTANSFFRMETPWNFASIEQTPNDWANIHKSAGFYYCKLFGNSNNEFEKEYIRIWKEKGDNLIDNIIDALDSLERSGLATALDYYSPLDTKVSTVDYDSIAVQIEAHKQWFRDRKAWLDDEIAKLEKETGIFVVPYSYPTDSNAIYDLQGRRVQNPKRGVYIQNGKKHIWK